MKQFYGNFVESIKDLHCTLTQNHESQIPANLETFLDNLEINDDQYFLILDNLILNLAFILKIISKYKPELLKAGHVAIHVSRAVTKSLFPSQIIKCSDGEYLFILSLKGKIFKWVREGFSKQVKKALIYQMRGQQRRWILGVDAVSAGYGNINYAINEVKLTRSIISRHIHKVIEGASYIGKKNIPKKSLISQFAEGDSVEYFLKNYCVNLIWVFVICYGSVVALQDLHRQGITHNDLNLGNILLFFECNFQLFLPRISGFGIAEKHADINSRSFAKAASNDIRKLSYGLFTMLKIDFEVKEHTQKLELNKLLSLMKEIHMGKTNYNCQQLIEHLDCFAKQMTNITKLIKVCYPTNCNSSMFSNGIKDIKSSDFFHPVSTTISEKNISLS